MPAKQTPRSSRRAAPAARTAKAKTSASAMTPTSAQVPPSNSTSLFSVLRDDGSVDPARDPRLPDAQSLDLYRAMVQAREFDRRMLVLQRQGRIGFYGPILGQEAATIGSAAALSPEDWLFPALREGAAAMLRGLSLTEAIAQLIGNGMDRCKGRQMPCHYTHRESHYVAMSSVIGTQVSHAVGAAMAARIRGDRTVVIGYLGDGATSANDFHAGMNMAAVTKAPVVLFCQNNQWAISVPISAQHASETIAVKGRAYGMHSVRVDGNDVLAVFAVTREAIARARRGDGPTFIEALTYRRLGHSSSDEPSRYRDEAEVKAWEKRDPIDRFRRYLEKRKLWDARQEEALLDRIAQEVNVAISTAEAAAKQPPPESLITDVFREVPESLASDFRAAHGGAETPRPH